ncbi:MAG: alpha/beta hydrolase-fold protein [Mycobacteriales bacterium]
MSLISSSFLLLVGVVALIVAAGTWWCWNRWTGWAAVVARALSLLLVLAMGGVSAAAYANHVYGFYASVDDLLGSIPAQRYQPPSSFGADREQATVLVETPGWQTLAVRNARVGHGTLLKVVLPGPRSGITRRALLYLPAAYSRGTVRAAFPVIEMFNGYPGKPSNFPRLLDLGPTVDAEIAAARMPPTVVVIPTVYEHRSSECVDAVNNGERDETYLAVDVPADLAAAFRVAPGRSFATLGYSEGGFCAANLGLHHPDRYGAVVSLSGYFTAGIVRKTIPYLYGRKKAAIDRNSPLWWVQHRNPTGPPLWLMSSSGDPGAVRDVTALRNAARRYAPRLTVVTPVVEGGGHNFNTWLRAFPAALDFLGGNLPPPLTDPLTLPNLAR